jgi:uncharacterized protein
MPYFITDQAADCAGWATVKEDGEVMGCHTSKQAAIDQALAIAQSEGSTFEGERALPDNYRPATADDVPEGRACGNCMFFDESDVAPDGRALCTRWDEYVEGGFYCNAWEPSGRGYPDGDDERSVGMEVTPVQPRSKGADVEFRSFTGELRAEGDGNTFVGYAAVFNSPSEPLPFIERIAPGAFAKSLRARKQDIKLYVNHNSDMVLASRRSGSLRLSEDSIGLRVEADLPDTSYARDLKDLMQRGIVDKMSFGFQVDKRGDSWNEDGTERTLTSVRLFEVSVVTGFPAYEATQAAVRSLEKLSERTGMAVDELSEALDALADGQELDPVKAELLMGAIKQATPQPEPEPVNLLALKQKHMDLLAKKVW